MTLKLMTNMLGVAAVCAAAVSGVPRTAHAQQLLCSGSEGVGQGLQFVIPASEATSSEATRELFSDFQQNRHTATVCLCQGNGTQVSFNIQLIDPSNSVSEGTLRVSPGSCGTVQSVGFVKAQLPQGGQTVRGVIYVSDDAE
tara:strand:+ start:556 stop:981 length:426 start_codon:yes stop_codon:yes gene_type:complete